MPKRKKKYAYYIRDFLNKKGFHSIAFILAHVDEHTVEQLASQNYDSWCDAQITLGDCSRAITLNFDFGDDEDDQDNALYKVDRLLIELQKFKEAIISQIAVNRVAKARRDERLKRE